MRAIGNWDFDIPHGQTSFIILFTVVVVLIARRILRISTLNDVSGPPSPSWLLGHGIVIHKAPVGTLYKKWAREYGPTYKLKGAFGLSSNSNTAHVLYSSNYVRPQSTRLALIQFFGKSLFSAEGEEHKHSRAVLATAFTTSNVREVSHVIFDLAYGLVSAVDHELDQHSSGSTAVIEMTSLVHRVALDAIAMTAYAYDVRHSGQSIPKLIHKISDVPQTTFTLLANAFVDVFPTLLELPNPMKQWTAMLPTELGRLADAAWAQNVQNRDVGMHSKLLDSLSDKTATGEPMTRETAIGHLVGMLFAGYETTANVIAECLYELARQPRVQTRVQDELARFERNVGRKPTYDDLMSATHLIYFDAVTRETLRTIPLLFPIPGTGRSYVNVTPGQIVHVPVRDGINIDPAIWGPDAAEFRPERWLDEDGLPEAAKAIHAPGHVLTFGDGLKICLGRKIGESSNLLAILIATLLRNFTFEEDGSIYDFYRTGGNTIKPVIRGREKEGAQMYLHVRMAEVD
ncbi:cytochrome P450 [Laetiporus sulphureus 93-53]|uniref:Cytochrome P450 n=1 Tax=Laetiporus sulphureus 93-53 TaxID=1314785 RepID=A0A165CHA8_9APHY|nr:cytochrome P450 [Laetiporus sulphureus 93-53]KZT02809.1 cytochrome P450 [Laetiporus sulphureus 93-53]